MQIQMQVQKKTSTTHKAKNLKKDRLCNKRIKPKLKPSVIAANAAIRSRQRYLILNFHNSKKRKETK
jgi:hypothetical protein